MTDRRIEMRARFTAIVTSASLLVLVLAGAPAGACTAFLLRHPAGPVMAANFDWDVAAGMAVVNPRGLAKTALVDEGLTPVRWTSRYGSVTVNQYGREFPIGGMNEAGLAMEVLGLADAVYSEPGDRRSIGALQWVQYCLDSFRTVGDVVASASELAISSPAPLHFLACDPSANCAIIEFLDGKLVARSERTLPLPVLTNNTYSESLEYLNRTLGYGGEPIEPAGTGSLARFARAAGGTHLARSKGGDDPVGDALAILDDVAQPKRTQWSMVYELQSGRLHVRTASNPNLRSIELAGLDLDCTAEPLVLDLASDGQGDVTSALVPYSTAANRELIMAGFGADEVTVPPKETLERMVSYPEDQICTFAAESE
jgi:choloylglycine hydrolase